MARKVKHSDGGEVVNQVVALELLDAHPENYRRHPASQIERIRASLRKFGQVRSVVAQVQDGRFTTVAGHGVIEAARAEGWESLRADVLPESWPAQRVKAYLVADNQLGRLAEDDNEQLANLIEEARAFDGELLAAMGYDDREFQALLDEVGRGRANMEDPGPELDKAEELRAKWGVESGQLWELGEHRLICGDCTDRAVVERVMAGEKANMVFSDPPYNCASENEIYGADVSKAMAGLKAAKWDQDFDLRPALDALPLADDVTVYLCSSHHLAPIIWAWMKEWATHHSWCVWNKPNPMPSLSKRHWTWNAELIPYATRGKHTFNFPSDGHALCVWTIEKTKETGHPTEKPVEVPAHAIAHSSTVGDLIFDGFLGSGTTLIACERLGRKCRGVEIEPKYVAVTLERWAVMTGQVPRLISRVMGRSVTVGGG